VLFCAKEPSGNEGKRGGGQEGKVPEERGAPDV
jgi:hypothetical protein